MSMQFCSFLLIFKQLYPQDSGILLRNINANYIVSPLLYVMYVDTIV